MGSVHMETYTHSEYESLVLSGTAFGEN